MASSSPRRSIASLEALLARPEIGRAEGLRPVDVLPLGWPELDEALPERGLPLGVTEIASAKVLGGPTRIALAAIRAAQQKDERAWCAWIDPEKTLHAPGIARRGVDLTRLFVVHPPRASLERAAVKVASSGAFDVVVIDADPVGWAPVVPARSMVSRRLLFVRKLALAAEERGARVLVLTAFDPRRPPWPVALRLELGRSPRALDLRVTKDRRGRVGVAKTIPMG